MDIVQSCMSNLVKGLWSSPNLCICRMAKKDASIGSGMNNNSSPVKVKCWNMSIIYPVKANAPLIKLINAPVIMQITPTKPIVPAFTSRSVWSLVGLFSCLSIIMVIVIAVIPRVNRDIPNICISVIGHLYTFMKT